MSGKLFLSQSPRLRLSHSFATMFGAQLISAKLWTQPPDGAGHGGDKEWFTIDTTSGMGHGFQYQFWTGFFACDFGQFNRSTDGGRHLDDSD